MPAFVLRFGSLDLSPYLRVGNDEGFDPYDGGGFEEPAFIDNPFGEGQGLSNVDSRNREMSWPLYLNATTKDGLHTLVRQINQEIRYAVRPLRVEWKDQDASFSTFYDVEFARFDSVFKMRPSAQKWLAGTLRVWTKPYGHTATERVIATVTGTGGFSVFAIPSAAGDIDAQLKVGLSSPSFAISGNRPQDAIISILPYQWQSVFNAATIAQVGNASLIGASGAVGSQVGRGMVAGGGQITWVATLTCPTALEDRSARILAAIRTPSAVAGNAQFFVHLLGQAAGFAAGTPTVLFTPSAANEWTLLDLGVLRPPVGIGNSFPIGIIAGQPTSANGTRVVDLMTILSLPETTTLVSHETESFGNGFLGNSATRTFDDANDVYTRHSDQDFYTRGGLKQFLRGQMPRVTPGASQQMLVGQFTAGPATPPAHVINADIAIRDRFTFAR